MKLFIKTKIELMQTPRGDVTDFQLRAKITKAKFNGKAIANPNSVQMAEIAKMAASKWLKFEIEDVDVSKEVKFDAALPEFLTPNIAICSRNKFRIDNDPNKANVNEKVDKASEVLGGTLDFEFTANDIQFFIPVDADIAENATKLNVLNVSTNETIRVETIKLTKYNNGENLLSLKLNEQYNDAVETIAAKVTGSKETAKPTNASNQTVPFSFFLAKMPNLMSLIDEHLQSKSSVTLS